MRPRQWKGVLHASRLVARASHRVEAHPQHMFLGPTPGCAELWVKGEFLGFFIGGIHCVHAYLLPCSHLTTCHLHDCSYLKAFGKAPCHRQTRSLVNLGREVILQASLVLTARATQEANCPMSLNETSLPCHVSMQRILAFKVVLHLREARAHAVPQGDICNFSVNQLQLLINTSTVVVCMGKVLAV